jgi:hypothetical protein
MTKARTLADNFAADINGITAGTGITGGGTSGTVTITNQMATTIDAKGDLVVGTGADAFGRLAVASTAGYVLTVDSAETTGLKWAVGSTYTALPAFSAYKSGTQNLSAATWTKITFETENFDTDSKFASSRFTPTVAGYYYIQGSSGSTSSNAALDVYVAIYKNGANEAYVYIADQPYAGANISRCIYLDSDDYVEIYANFSIQSDVENGNANCHFTGAGIRS